MLGSQEPKTQPATPRQVPNETKLGLIAPNLYNQQLSQPEQQRNESFLQQKYTQQQKEIENENNLQCRATCYAFLILTMLFFGAAHISASMQSLQK